MGRVQWMILSVLVTWLVVASNGEHDPLALLAFIPFTGSEPSDGRLCQASMELAVDHVNQHRTILNDYFVEVTYVDEAVLGTLSPLNLMKFLLRFEEPGYNPKDDGYLAPAVVGNYYICQAISGIIRQYDMVEFATWCAGTLFTGDRKNFPNLYRRVIPQEVFIATQLYLASYIGQWKEIGIVFFQDNISEFLVAKLLYETFEKHGIRVVWFASIISFENSNIIESLSNSRARIVYLGFYETPRMLAFICLAHHAGVRGPRYQFVAYGNSYADPYSNEIELPHGCTPRMVLEMYESVLFVGNFEGLAEGSIINKNTSLGYDLDEFEQRLALKTYSTRTADFARRYICHDAMVHALVTLDKTERKLKDKHNLTLRDFSSHPKLVLEVLNETAAFEPYEGLQHRLMYSDDRLEVDRRFQSIAQYNELDAALHIRWRLVHQGNTSKTLLNLSTHYEINKLSDIAWPTKNNLPTRDLSALVNFASEIPRGLFWSILALAVLGSAVLFGYVYLIIKHNGIFGVSDAKSVNCFLIFGAVIMTLASIFFVNPLSIASCNLQQALVITGFSSLSVALCSKLFLTYAYFKTKRHVSSSPRIRLGPKLLGTLFQRKVLSNEQKSALLTNIKEMDNRLRLKMALFVGLNVVLLVCWLVAHQHLEVIVVSSRPQFSESLDAYFTTTETLCYSSASFYWQICFATFNALPLLLGISLAFDLRHTTILRPLKEEVQLLRLSVLNALVLFALLVFGTSIVSGEETRRISWSFGLILHSNLSCFFALLPLIRARKNSKPITANQEESSTGRRTASDPKLTPNRLTVPAVVYRTKA